MKKFLVFVFFIIMFIGVYGFRSDFIGGVYNIGKVYPDLQDSIRDMTVDIHKEVQEDIEIIEEVVSIPESIRLVAGGGTLSTRLTTAGIIAEINKHRIPSHL